MVPCLRLLAAIVLLIKEADKFTVGQKLNVKVPHAILMNTQGHHFLSNSWLAQYQGLLCKNPWVTLETVKTLNPANFLPMEEGEPDHNCSKVTDKIYMNYPDMGPSHKESRVHIVQQCNSYLQEGVQKQVMQ